MSSINNSSDVDCEPKSASLKVKPRAGVKGSLVFLIADSFNLQSDSDDFKAVYGYVVSYITKGTSAFELQHILKPYCTETDFSAKVFRLRLHTSRYFSLSIKMFLLRMSSIKSVDIDIVKTLAAEFGIFICDAKRLYAIWAEHPKFRGRLKAAVREIPEDKRHLLGDRELNEYFNSIYNDIYKYIKFITYKKLRFIAKSSNLELADLHNDLLAKLLQSYYSLVPITLPDGHVVNYLKRAAHNHAINIIKTETTQKRGRLVSAGLDHEQNRVFSLMVVSENQMIVSPDMAVTSYDEVHGDSSADVVNKFELEFSVAEILTKLQRRGKKYRLLTILMGNEDEEFSTWLRARKRCSESEDNVDLQSKIPVKEFNQLISEFLHVSEDKLNVFLFKLREDLALPGLVKPTEVRRIEGVLHLKRKNHG